ncbi:alpha-D-ribose 1-methylphosphonate 5-triphosphate diphosphatase [Mycobacterium sp. 21AC1]|uniref:alpha-D-ribose 1-methylphosphonate 5-triphosphate diphosphatase n=1 Tax=[Mycobacterium] appelbergii TaxID=2939269 RepID=UPI0029390468|nr:alpha-D-ribose 1-methylphosphonate 5-triphosphate diphosphatase [Mycobacterium sp. 21AC1]MDV3129750.1 alpha-D-ribose 1-methylphosphonate 5-triphosphate diphosphatase [Mycobacterium sp. 21AC1]
MAHTVIEGVTVIPGGQRPAIPDAVVVLDDGGCVSEIRPDAAAAGDLFLVPAAVDLHLDNLQQRRRPRATVSLDHAGVLAVLDAECAAAGIGTVCLAARCEDSPRKGIAIADAPVLAGVVEALASDLCCDWRIHARVELTDDGSVDALQEVLAASSRVALISMIETSVQRSRFASLAETRTFYAQDWGVTEAEVEEVFTVDADQIGRIAERRKQVAALAAAGGIVLATHDDRTAEHVEEGYALGARVAEFPLTMAAAVRAHELGMHVVLGAPNAVRGRSTSSGNVLAADAVAAGVCDVLCSDYLPSALQSAPVVLDRDHGIGLVDGIDLISTNPAAVLGLPGATIEVGKALTASLRRMRSVECELSGPDAQLGMALWRDGRLVFGRELTGRFCLARR